MSPVPIQPSDLSSARAAVLAEARSWIGTPYHHEADIKGAGVDCAMLLVRVYVDAGILPPFDPRPYAPDWHCHQSAEVYLDWLIAQGAREIDAPDPGDVVVWRVGRTYSHGAIVTRWPVVVHAYAAEGRVVESDVSLPGPLSAPRHPRRAYTLWGGA